MDNLVITIDDDNVIVSNNTNTHNKHQTNKKCTTSTILDSPKKKLPYIKNKKIQKCINQLQKIKVDPTHECVIGVILTTYIFLWVYYI